MGRRLAVRLLGTATCRPFALFITVITVQRKTLVAVGSGDGGTIISNVYHIVNTFEGL